MLPAKRALGCPARECGRTVTKLYVGRLFLCRLCRSLAYESQLESALDRTLSRAQKVLDRPGDHYCLIDGFPQKPKGMHHTTYERLERRFRSIERGLGIEAKKVFDPSFGDMRNY